ncbi:MAG: hypothetical protein F4X94_04910, partial [Dehalococcoidia bacterium]|nr:hypothetical protein [Dehalococcoidia bacterium]
MPSAHSSSETIREEAVNTLLARLLRGYGASTSARAERRSAAGTPDVRVTLRTDDSVVLECKWEGSANQLEAQLDERLSAFPDSLGLIGVLYPERLRQLDDVESALDAAEDIRWWLHGSRGERTPEHRIRTGSVAELSDHLRALPLELEGADEVVAATGVVGYAIERAAEQVARHERISRRISDAIASTDRERDRAAARRIGCLVLFNAIAFQDRLAAVNSDVPTVQESWRNGVRGLRDDWFRICDEIDYVPVFELGAAILDILLDAPMEMHSPVIGPLIRAMNSTRQLEGHDLSGRLFHTLLTDAKFTGAYYTSVPAATLLAELVFNDWPSDVDWSDHEFPASLNVADLACGTGTLLMAVAAEAERRHEEAGGRNAAELHKAMVEQALHGYDVQLSAIHFAATSLAMLNPHIEFDRMNLYVMPLGREGSQVSLGSLDFLGREEVAVQFALSSDEAEPEMSPRRVSGRGTRSVAEGVTATLPELDLAIMNPPFTRSVGGNLLFGSLPTAERRVLQRELSDRLSSRQASATAGLGAAFVAAASPKLRPGEGRLALVLPATVCTGPSWTQTRSLIEQDFHLDMVITSHDPLRWNFSDSTDLSEALLIATRRDVSDTSVSERRTTFVNLWQNPEGVLDSHRLAQAITRTIPAKLEEPGTALIEVDGRHVGEAVSMPTSMIAGKKWAGVQFSRADLVRSALKLINGGEVWVPGNTYSRNVPMCQVSQLGIIGPDIRDVRDGFEPTDTVTAYPMVANHDTAVRRWIATMPDKYLAPLSEARQGRSLRSVDKLWPKAGRLLIGARYRLNTARVISMRSEVNVLASMWWPVRLENELTEKALAAWMNSSLGLLVLLAERNTTDGAWAQTKKADLQVMPVLDTRRLSDVQMRDLSSLFDELAEEEFERLPGMEYCPARKRLDDGISKVLGLPD